MAPTDPTDYFPNAESEQLRYLRSLSAEQRRLLGEHKEHVEKLWQSLWNEVQSRVTNQTEVIAALDTRVKKIERDLHDRKVKMAFFAGIISIAVSSLPIIVQAIYWAFSDQKAAPP